MLKAVHRAITVRALYGFFSPQAIDVIVAANLGLDSLPNQLGHDEYHFDGNAFAGSWAFIDANRTRVRAALEAGEAVAAWRAFGRLTHTAQDLYAHSNYVSLWLERFPEAERPEPEMIDPMDRGVLESPDLRSGKLYYPLEALAFLPVLKALVLPFLPRDSHAWMNLDGPGRGPLFDYAYAAAVKRTRYEFDRTVAGLSPDLLSLFRQ
jgi:hypothetical protein